MSDQSPSSRTSARVAADLGDATLSPLDGRYRPAVEGLIEHLSEPALNRERLRIEVAWLLHLSKQQVLPGLRRLSDEEVQRLHGIAADFDADTVVELREIERTTVHDVKAVEYLLKARLAGTSLEDVGEFVHFACTSEDINNLAYARLVQRAVREVWLPAATSLTEQVATLARAYRSVPMLARTHGQPATPTTIGKELAVLAHRLRRQLDRIHRAEYLGKLNGATGTYAAHYAAAPDADWQAVSRDFVEGLGLTWNPLTTQIESHDWQAELYADAQPVQPGAAQPLHRRVDVHLAGLLHPADVSRVDRLLDDAPQGQPHPLRERRGQPRALRRAAGGAAADAGHLAAAARPHRLHHAAQHRGRSRATRCWPSTTSPAASPRSTSTPRVLDADLEGSWEVLGRGGADGDAAARTAEPVRAAQGADQGAARRRPSDGGVRPGSRPARGRHAVDCSSSPRRRTRASPTSWWTTWQRPGARTTAWSEHCFTVDGSVR